MNERFKLVFFGVALVAVAGMLFWQKKAQITSESVTINGVTVPPVPVLDVEEIARGQAIYSQAVLTFIKTSWGIEEREFQWWISFTQNDLYE